MSNDLISRSALLESVNYYYTHTPNDSPEHYAYGVALKEIREHPTAFDKEKVIAEIQNQLELSDTCAYESDYPTEVSYYKGRSLGHEIDIEIIEKGGIE